jgi:hypothetical protein
MTDKMLLRFFTYGIPEYILLFFVSLFIWINVLIEGFTFSVFLDILLLLMTIPISIWVFFNKTKGRAHFIITAVRVFLVVMALNIMNIDSVMFNESDNGLYWFFGSMIFSIFVMVIYFLKENKKWEITLQKMIQAKKIDIQNKKFRILVILIHDSITSERVKKVVPICLSAILLRYFISKEYLPILARLICIILACALSGIGARFLSWAVNLIKLEKKLNIEFLTEYADREKLARMSRRKW